MGQLLGPDGLVALHAASLSDLAHNVGRDIAGQNNSGKLTTESFAHAGDHLEAGHAVRQTIICDDDIRLYRASRQRHRLFAVRNCGSAVSLACKLESEHLAHRRIGFDDQNLV